jgi:hypothetical protein
MDWRRFQSKKKKGKNEREKEKKFLSSAATQWHSCTHAPGTACTLKGLFKGCSLLTWSTCTLVTSYLAE